MKPEAGSFAKTRRRDIMNQPTRRLPWQPRVSGGLRSWPLGWAVVACLAAVTLSLLGLRLLPSGPPHHPRALRLAAPGPASPPAQICNDKAILQAGPWSAPGGAITVPAGDDSSIDWSRANTTYWFAPGLHTLGLGVYTQIIPGTRSRYIGAPGAVLDGQHANAIAFGGDVSDVTVEYLTIQNFITPGNQGAVNASAAPGWTIKYDTVQDIVPGTAIYAGTDNIIEYDCLTRNGQSGFGTYTIHDTSRLTNGASNVDVNDNEISYNDTCNWERQPDFRGPPPPPGCAGAGEYPDCGCSAGGKFWQTDGGEFEDNFVNNNYSVGIWWDTNNVGFDIEGNYISNNYDDGLIYEISYNALIRDNTFVRNGLVAGAANPGFPIGAIYVSESGSDDRVPTSYGTTFQITENTLKNNWDGVILWENANRFCNSPANSSAGSCTLVNPAVTLHKCNAHDISREPYYSDCRWKTQNVLVDHNLFYLDPANIGSSCTLGRGCGFQGLFSEYGSYPSWSPYMAAVVERRITFDQNNHFVSNVYVGPWRFMALDQGQVVGWSAWRASPYHQDAGSTLSRAGV
ncbi:MAG: right-handed parallel beta-helix repeat-containing protein [Streptosporangiaceae bacterium]